MTHFQKSETKIPTLSFFLRDRLPIIVYSSFQGDSPAYYRVQFFPMIDDKSETEIPTLSFFLRDILPIIVYTAQFFPRGLTLGFFLRDTLPIIVYSSAQGDSPKGKANHWDPRGIPDICHFFYAGRIFESHVLHPKKIKIP